MVGRAATTPARESSRLASVVALILLAGCGGAHHEASASASAPPVAIVAATVVQRTVPITAEFVATTAAMQAVDVIARVQGTLDNVYFKPGSLVRQGQLLFKIQQDKYLSAVQAANASLLKSNADLIKARDTQPVAQAQAAVDAKKSELHRADLTVARMTPLAAAKVVPQKDLDNALASQETARADLAGAIAQLTNAKVGQEVGIQQATAAILNAKSQLSDAKLNLSYTTIYAPVGGLIGFLAVDQGNVVGSAGDQVLDTISTIDPIQVNFSVDEVTYIELVNKKNDPRQRSLFEQPLELELADNSIYPEKGRLYAVNRTLDTKTGTIAVEATFPNPDGTLRPGQFARVRLTTQDRPNAVLVPQTAVVQTQGATTAYVVAPGDTIQLRSLTLGPRYGNFFVVEDGLKAGERVVAQGTQKVRPGERVVVTNAAGARP